MIPHSFRAKMADLPSGIQRIRHILIILFAASVIQAEFIVEDGFCIIENEEYLQKDSCQFEINDSNEDGACVLSYLEIIKEMPESVHMKLEVKKYYKGDYSVDVGITFGGSICDEKIRNFNLASKLANVVGVSTKMCPIQPGLYGRDCFSGFEDNEELNKFPNGMYRTNYTLFDENGPIVTYIMYINIT